MHEERVFFPFFSSPLLVMLADAAQRPLSKSSPDSNAHCISLFFLQGSEVFEADLQL